MPFVYIPNTSEDVQRGSALSTFRQLPRGAGFAAGGAGGAYALTNTGVVGTADNCTMMCWAYPTATPGAGGYFNWIAAVQTSASSNQGIGISIFNNAGTIRWNMGTDLNDFVSTVAPVLNAWVHIAFIRNGTTKTMYINGVANGSGTDVTTPASRFGIGIFAMGGLAANDKLVGRIAHVRQWVHGSAVPLSAQEIQAEMRSAVAVRQRHLKGSYPLTSKTDRFDYTVNRNHFTFTNTWATQPGPPFPVTPMRRKRSFKAAAAPPSSFNPQSGMFLAF